MSSSIYIMSLEASDIYSHNYRESNLKREYLGMIPYSLESIKLVESGLRVKYIESRDKHISNDIINVKFKSSVKSANELVKMTNKKIENLMKQKEDGKISEDDYKMSVKDLNNFINNIKESSSKNNEHWGKKSVSDLRYLLYTEGFKIKYVTNRGNSVKEVEYVVYKRSSSKSRTGQCLFIRKDMANKMLKWSRMGLPFSRGQKVDLASLLAYESLVGSAIEGVININPDKILMVDDIDSNFKRKANVVKTNKKTGFLDSFTVNDAEISNSLFDGESLLSSDYFPKDKAMLLLRNHMFKSASFSCNIQDFFEDNCPDDINYEDWQLEDMYGNKLYAKDIDMICTPSSLKSLKFSNILPTKTDKEMWDYWKGVVKNDGNIFGVCKSEKASKISSMDGKVVQQTSYQMINCLPINKSDVTQILYTEKDYIKRLQEDDIFLMQEIYKHKDITNVNEAIYNIYMINNNIVNTNVFKKFKAEFIYRRRNHAKKGKIKLVGDYSVMLGNPIELLYHSIGKFNLDTFEPELVGNQVYCKMFEDNEELVGFRNPNTSPSNVLYSVNKKSEKIDKYLNLTDNIVVVNAIDFPIQDILSGCDYDSDTVMLSNNRKLVEIGKMCSENYNVCLNKIDGDKKQYKLTKEDHYTIDNQLSYSQKNIGRVVNLGQFCMSVYWDLVNSKSNSNKEGVKELLKKVDVMTVLSGIAIDMAKKFYDIDIEKEIEHVSKNSFLSKRKNKPLFWETVSVNPSIKGRLTKYNCPMDFLIEELNSLPASPSNFNSMSFSELIIDLPKRNVNNKQMSNVESMLEDYVKSCIFINAMGGDDRRERLLENESMFSHKLSKLKLKSDTICTLLKKIEVEKEEELIRSIKVLYDNHWDEFQKVLKSAEK